MLFAPEAFAWPDLRVVKTGPVQAAPGETLTYTLNYTNVGPVKSTSVVMKDFLPANVTVITLNGGSLSGSTISWNIGTLNSKARGSRSIQVRLGTNLVSGTTITNKSQIFGNEPEEPGDDADNYSKWITTIFVMNRPPVAHPDAYTVAEDSVLNVVTPGLLSNDSDPDGNSLSVTLVAGPSNGTLTLNSNGSFNYRPATNYNGTDSFTYRASDGTTNSGVVTVTLNVTPVNDAPGAQPDSYTVAEDNLLTITAPGVLSNDSDFDGNSLTAVLVGGTSHGALTLNSNGSFTYRPATNFHGADSFTYRANDGITNSGVVTVTLTVTPVNDAPLGQPDAYAVAEDGELNRPAPGVLGNDSDVEVSSLTAILVSVPAHGTLTLNSDGSFNYRPATNYNGSDSFTYLANDGATNSGIITVTLNVTPVNDAPVAQTDFYTVSEEGVLNIAGPGVLGNDNDPDGNNLTAVLVNGPAHGTLTLNPDGGFSYTPDPNYSGPDSFTYRANDGTTDSGIITVTLNVTAVNDAPIAQPDAYTVAEDGTLDITVPGVVGNDSDVDGNILTALLVASPIHGSLILDTNGGFNYTPATNYTGLDSFTYRVNDGTTNSGIVMVTLNVTPVNDAPIARPDSYSVAEDGVLTVTGPGVLANDADTEGDVLTAIIVNGPTHGTLTLNPDGSFGYTPVPNYNGPDSFTYRANDGTTDSGIITVTLNVTAVNDAPIAQPDAYTIAEDGTLNIAVPGVLGNDSDVDGDVLTAILVTAPAQGNLTLNPDGSFSYTPNPNYNGPDSFAYRANDGATNSGIVIVTFHVTPINDAPVAQPDNYLVAEDGTLNIPGPGVLGNDTDLDGDVLTSILVNGPVHGTLTLNPDGSFSYTPDSSYNGLDSFSYRANDGTTNSGIVTVTLNVTAVNDAPVALPDLYNVAKGGVLNVPAAGVLGNDSDIDGDPLNAILGTNPTHGTLTLNPDGSFTYIPEANYDGTDSFTYRAYDGTTNSGVVTVTLAVTSVNSPPIAQRDAYTLLVNETLNVSGPGVLGNDSDPDGNTLIAVLVAGPSRGTLFFNANGSFLYTPETNFIGTASFTYRANDGTTNSEITTVTLEVKLSNNAPLAVNDSYVTPPNSPLFVFAPGVLGNDVDTDGDELSAVIVTVPIHGQLAFNTNGSFSYVPATNFIGLDTFTYRATDGTIFSAEATVAITVTQTNSPPNTNNWSGNQYTAYEDTNLNISVPGVLAGLVDVDGDHLSAVLVSGPSHGVMTLNSDGSFDYLAETNYFGPDSFRFFVTDNNYNTAVLTAEITVVPVNDAPGFVRGGDVRIQPNSGPQSVLNWATQISAGPINESVQVVTFEVTSSNPALFVTAPTIDAGGTLTYTPASNISGVATITVIARDNGSTANGGSNTSAPQTFTITINTPPTVQITSPTNGASFFAPGGFTVLAEAQDLDGYVAQVDFYLATNKLATVTNAPFFVLLTNLPVGNYTMRAVATDDFAATNSSAPVTVSVIELPPLTLLSSVYYNPQTDYFEQRVRITNPTYSTLNAVRVMVQNLTNTPAITVGNASGITNGVPYVETPTVVSPGSHVDMVIEFISPLRVKPNPLLRAELVPAPANSTPLQGQFQRINRAFLLANHTFLVEFATQTNRIYMIQYSDDVLNWKNAQPAIPGNGNWVQWIDNGLPKTDRPPAQSPARFYRLIQLP